jgi:hypothetical protein
MNSLRKVALYGLPVAAFVALCCSSASAQVPAPLVPAVVDTTKAIIVGAVLHKTSGFGKFQGYVINSNIAQVTVHALGDDQTIRTFALSPDASAKMQTIVDKGGYQWGDKVTIIYDPSSLKAIKVKGKPSRPV